ncbi:hypothetical protein PILCRDRAFT_666335 [Piloderma croceum F 1598]|uniref:C2 domain-containing protein n=1 Tax=Piloderma croceum (strain F 1598) TaxID=765440 RepID=A0A0C3BEE6_PILCF|nr:hypothetical protein PILCRDRAFT_666335 [Piloderma croceum F 1598]
MHPLVHHSNRHLLSLHSQQESVRSIKVSDISVDGLSKRWGLSPRCYARLVVDTESQETEIADRSTAPKWQRAFYFNTADSAILDLRIYQKHTKEKDEFLGGMRDDISKLLADQSESVERGFP